MNFTNFINKPLKEVITIDNTDNIDGIYEYISGYRCEKITNHETA